MNCKEFRKRQAEQPRLPDAEGLKAHASACPECARLLEDEHIVGEALGLLRHATAGEQASPATERYLIDEFSNRRESVDWKSSTSTLRATWPWLAAAAAGIILGVLVWRFSTPVAEAPTAAQSAPSANAGPPPGANRQMAGTGQSMPDRVPALPPGNATLSAGVRRDFPGRGSGLTRPSTARVGQAAAPRRRARLAVGTEFFPTMQFVADELGTELQLVRVRVSKKTLEGFGLSLDPLVADRTVKADLLIGPDGLTRAIRFISERD
jgi:hypothetical protein